MFKFSLRLCIWLALLVGSVLGLVLDREPWVMEEKPFTESDLSLFPTVKNSVKYSPDGTREIDLHRELLPGNSARPHELVDRRNGTKMMELNFKEYQAITFADDNTMVAMKFPSKKDEEFMFILCHRRFPEWWWGIFYRPLFWIAVVVFIGTCIEFVSMRKRLRIG